MKMPKTLLETLNKTKFQKVNVKIGSKQGSSFFYCGSGSNAIPHISKKIDGTMLRQAQNRKKLLINRLTNLDKIYQDRINKAIKSGKVKNKEKYIAEVEILKERERKVLPTKISEIEYDISVRLLDRPVQEIVDGISPDEKPCKIIYIKGHEIGKYWTVKEYLGITKRKE